MMTKNQTVAIIALAAAIAGYLTINSGPRDGKAIFKGEGCTTCHSFKGIGSGTIDISDITKERSDAWIKDQIIDARLHDPNSGMPRFGYLEEHEIDELVRFLHSDPQR